MSDRQSYTFHCTKETPYRGGLRPGVSVLHAESHSAGSNRRQCSVCRADLGLDFERSWERADRLESEARRKAERVASDSRGKRAKEKNDLPAPASE